MIINLLRKFIVKEAMNSIDISKAISIGNAKNLTKNVKTMPTVTTTKRTVINDVIDNPEQFVLEAWLDKNQINLRVRRRYEENELEENSILVDTVGEK